jgi:hypothetical protein
MGHVTLKPAQAYLVNSFATNADINLQHKVNQFMFFSVMFMFILII